MSTTSHEGLLALSSTMLGLSTIAVGLRFYARTVQKAPLKTDDWIMIPTIILLAATTGTTFYGLQKKVLGYPTPKDHKIPVSTAAMTSKLYMAFDWFSITTLGCVKTSALFFYKRIFCVVYPRSIFKYIIIASVVAVVLWTCAFIILTGLQCGTHFSALWIAADHKRYCTISYRFLLGFAISDFLLDLWIIALPIPQIWAIQSTPRRKLAIMGIFALALVGLGACIARMVVYIQIEHVGPGAHVDARLVNTKAIYLSVLEAGLSCIAVNLPTLSSLLSKLTPENLLRSVRSIISLRSMSSKAPSQSKEVHLYGNRNDKLAGSSQSYLHRPDAIEIETLATHDIESSRWKEPGAEVEVTKTLSQVSERIKE